MGKKPPKPPIPTINVLHKSRFLAVVNKPPFMHSEMGAKAKSSLTLREAMIKQQPDFLVQKRTPIKVPNFRGRRPSKPFNREILLHPYYLPYEATGAFVLCMSRYYLDQFRNEPPIEQQDPLNPPPYSFHMTAAAILCGSIVDIRQKHNPNFVTWFSRVSGIIRTDIDDDEATIFHLYPLEGERTLAILESTVPKRYQFSRHMAQVFRTPILGDPRFLPPRTPDNRYALQKFMALHVLRVSMRTGSFNDPIVVDAPFQWGVNGTWGGLVDPRTHALSLGNSFRLPQSLS
uniref:ARAD1D08162p n=1 Tax=Blastobotrys adeninivorans TaxID=409370 RepID=A0A060T8L8_BLAAD